MLDSSLENNVAWMHSAAALRELGPTYSPRCLDVGPSPLSLDVAPLGGGPANGVGDFTDIAQAMDKAAHIITEMSRAVHRNVTRCSQKCHALFTEMSRAVDASFTPVVVDWRIVRARV